MEAINGKLKKWELAETVFVAITGTLLHFVYGWSRDNRLVGLVAPVNESVFEHLKLVFVPVLLFTILQYFNLGEICTCLLWIKLRTVIGSMAFIVIFFYCYTGMLQRDIAWLDIGSFYVAVLLNGIWAYKALKGRCGKNGRAPGAAWLMWAVLALLMVLGTVYPPIKVLPGLFVSPV